MNFNPMFLKDLRVSCEKTGATCGVCSTVLLSEDTYSCRVTLCRDQHWSSCHFLLHFWCLCEWARAPEFSLTRELCLLFGEEFASAASSHSMVSSAEVWSCFSHAVSLATERLWISQINYTLGITISMLNSMTFYFIGYLLVPVFWEMENSSGKVNGRTKVCICYLLCFHPKHWVLSSIMLLADVAHFEVLLQEIVPEILVASQLFKSRFVVLTS